MLREMLDKQIPSHELFSEISSTKNTYQETFEQGTSPMAACCALVKWGGRCYFFLFLTVNLFHGNIKINNDFDQTNKACLCRTNMGWETVVKLQVE